MVISPLARRVADQLVNSRTAPLLTVKEAMSSTEPTVTVPASIAIGSSGPGTPLGVQPPAVSQLPVPPVHCRSWPVVETKVAVTVRGWSIVSVAVAFEICAAGTSPSHRRKAYPLEAVAVISTVAPFVYQPERSVEEVPLGPERTASRYWLVQLQVRVRLLVSWKTAWVEEPEAAWKTPSRRVQPVQARRETSVSSARLATALVTQASRGMSV